VFKVLAYDLFTDRPKLIILSAISVVPELRIEVVGGERPHKVLNEETRLFPFRLVRNR
jgi:hypothetical protein